MSPGVLRIFVVEDNPGDVRLLKECLKNLHMPWNLAVACDGAAAVETLTAPANVVPDLILLDLNLPGKHGHEVLREVKAHPRLRSIPVIIFSSSKAAQDVDEAYKEYANCYVIKPTDLRQYVDLMRLIEHFWHKQAELPSRGLASP